MEKHCQGNIVMEILMDRRNKILTNNTCVMNDEFIRVIIGLVRVIELYFKTILRLLCEFL
jgi:hypothetical protein